LVFSEGINQLIPNC